MTQSPGGSLRCESCRDLIYEPDWRLRPIGDSEHYEAINSHWWERCFCR